MKESNIKRKERDIWQRHFGEHTIRDEEDLFRHIDYIHYNSVKHYGIRPKEGGIYLLKILPKKDITTLIGVI